MANNATLSGAAALEAAQDTIYDAWEATDAKHRVKLARKALAISPLCADAYVLLAEEAQEGSDEELDLWRRGVEAGESALGEAAFKELSGSFWGFLETRPYMRARFGLAQALWRRNARDEAIDCLREMLRLNPDDNQGVRYILAAYLIEVGRDDDLAKLLKKFRGDAMADWAWTSALAAFRRTGDSEDSRKLLAKAIAGNKHVSAYLTNEKAPPKTLPPFISLGGVDEAVHYVHGFREGWSLTPGAIDWLRSFLPPPRPSKKRRPRPDAIPESPK
jgi:tetratricopeptide (TPR) repeat protein